MSPFTSARWSVAQVWTAVGFQRWTHRDTVRCCIMSRVALHSLALHCSHRSFKHLFITCRPGFIYLLQYFCAASRGVWVVKPRVTEQRVTNWWKVYHNDRTESWCTFGFPTQHHVEPNAFLLYHSVSWAFCYQSSCSFVLLAQCKSAEAALGFVFKERLAFFCLKQLVTFFIFILCPCCSSSLPSVLHLALAVNHVCLFPLFEPCFCLLVLLA